MNKTKIGYMLMAGAVAVWAYSWYQQSNALESGAITAAQTLTLTDRLASPAGVAFAVGAFLAYPDISRRF